MKIKSITPVEPVMTMQVRIEVEKGDDTDEKFHDYVIRGWAVVDEGDGNDVIQPVVIDGYGILVTFSQLAGQLAQEIRNFSDVDYQILDDKGDVPS